MTVSPYKLVSVIALFAAAWALFGVGQRYEACQAILHADNARLAAIDAAMKSRLDRLATLLRQGPLDPTTHEIDRILAADDPTVEAFGILGPWIDPSLTVPSWSGDNSTVPEGLSAEGLYRLRFTAFSNIWMQAQIIAVHLVMRNDADIGLVRNHQTALVREIDWLGAVNARSPQPALSSLRCIHG